MLSKSYEKHEDQGEDGRRDLASRKDVVAAQYESDVVENTSIVMSNDCSRSNDDDAPPQYLLDGNETKKYERLGD